MGVTILAILALIGGILGILGGIAVVFVGSVVATATSFGGLVTLIGLVLLVLAVVELVLAYGFWMLKPWAWQLGFYLEAATVVLTAFQFLFGGGASFMSLVISIVVAGIIFYYLNTPEVRKAFGAPERGFPVVGDILAKK
jgi:uncharacterized membrane protein (DUF2068 family)